MVFDVPFILWALLLMTLGNLLVFRGLKTSVLPALPPFVSILVPARNEARNIRPCVLSLLSQDYPAFELLVLDDDSTDETGEIVRQVLAHEARGKEARVMNGLPLEQGWSGKNWACHQLAQQARGEYLFFTDADTAHAPGMITSAVSRAQSARADLLTAWPLPVTKTLGEKLVIPIIYLIGFVFCAHWLIALLQRFPRIARTLGSRFTKSLGAANGQFLFFSRNAYNRIGGHSSVRDNIAEDVALGREITARMADGMRLCICDAFQFSEVRMYRSFRETWDGFSKNLRSAFGQQRLIFWLFLLALWACFLGPTVKWIWLAHNWHRAAFVIGIRSLVTLRCRTSWISVLLHPIAILLVIIICLRSWWLSRGEGVTWKGRLYRVNV